MSDDVKQAAPTEEVAPKPGTPEHDAAMAAKFEGKSTPPAEDRPEWLPENFKSPEDLVNSYRELQSKLSTVKQPPSDDATSDALAKAGIKMESLATEYWQNGDLSEESYTKLEAAGIDRETVKSYADGQRALVMQRGQTAYEAAGGKENYSKLTQWAAVNVNQESIDAFNTVLRTGTPEQIANAVAVLKNAYTEYAGSDPDLLSGTGAQGDVSGYRSLEEMKTAMRDPKYKKDPAYRRDVEAKIAASDFSKASVV